MSNSNDLHSFPAIAVALTIAAGIVLAGMDAFAKFLSLELPFLVVLWGRYFFHTAITFGSYGIKTRSLKFLRARRPDLQFIRALALFGATFFMYIAITRMPLGDAASIQFLAPVLVTALSGLLLGEQIGPRRWMGVGFGFIGVLLVARPGSGILGWDALLPLATAVLLAFYMLLTRIIRDKDDAATTTFYTTALGAFILSLLVIFNWQTPTPMQWILMVTMGSVCCRSLHAGEGPPQRRGLDAGTFHLLAGSGGHRLGLSGICRCPKHLDSRRCQCRHRQWALCLVSGNSGEAVSLFDK